MRRALALAIIGALQFFAVTDIAAQDSCAAPDPEEYTAVYACLQSAGPQTVVNKSCQYLRERYAGLLRKAGMSANRALQHLPDCTILVRAVSDLSGKTPSWAGCTGYPRGFDAEHLKRCLGAAPDDRGCTGLIDDYRRGLMDADQFGQLPRGYSDPSCTQVAQAFATPSQAESAERDEPTPRVAAQWAECLEYEPANIAVHMKRCLGPDFTGLTTCRKVQQAYESKLKAAYNGLPPGYVAVPCPEAQDIVALGQAQIEERQQAALAARLARERARAARETSPPPPPEVSSGPPWYAVKLSLPNTFVISFCFLASVLAFMFETGRRVRLARKSGEVYDPDEQSTAALLLRSPFTPVYILISAPVLYYRPIELIIGGALASVVSAMWRTRLEASGYFD